MKKPIKNFKIHYSTNLRTALISFAFLFLFNNCTYDRTLIYGKNYKVGDNKFLRYDGFYFSKHRIITDQGEQEFIYPIFFYRDGSVIRTGAVKDTMQLMKWIIENPKGILGYWGNYQINKDTISIETIASYGGSFHHERRTRMGVIKNDNIYFFQEINRKGEIDVDTETVFFEHFINKPDSTSNWIRGKKKFNR